MKVALIGVGTTGSHVARQLLQSGVSNLTLYDPDGDRLRQVAKAIVDVASDEVSINTDPLDDADPPDVAVIAGPIGGHVAVAERWLNRGSHIVSVSDDLAEVAALLELDDLARRQQRCVAVGAGFAPGLSCVLARYAADQLDRVEVISVYKAGTGGPACARQHHRALKGDGHDWLDGEWVLRRGGSGRDLAWFPDPFGAHDCYRAALPSPVLLQRVFPEAHRISARMAATRRDRFTSRLPMLRPPHLDGGPGAIRVEVRGRLGRAVETVILGVIDHPSVASGTLAAVATEELAGGGIAPGARGLASWPDPKHLLAKLRHRGVRVATFSGALDAAQPHPVANPARSNGAQA